MNSSILRTSVSFFTGIFKELFEVLVAKVPADVTSLKMISLNMSLQESANSVKLCKMTPPTCWKIPEFVLIN
jgi:hypothetical protein